MIDSGGYGSGVLRYTSWKKKYKLGREQASAMPMIFVTCVQSITITQILTKHHSEERGEKKPGLPRSICCDKFCACACV